MCWGERCRPCTNKRQAVRSDDDRRVKRQQREYAAPGLNSTARKRLLAKWLSRGVTCAYCCSAMADTIDHAVPLVRGGTNHEGNLVPCCRSCNSSKGARLIVEMKAGRKARRMTRAVEWKRKHQPIKAIPGEQVAFNICPECGSLCVNRYCNGTCGSRYTSRRKYRVRVGIPLEAPLYLSDDPKWRRTWAA